MIRFADYKQQYRLNLRLAGPVIMSQAGQIVVQLADNIMVGRLGKVPFAGVSFGSTVYWGMFIFCMGLTMGLTPLVGEKYAQSRFRDSAAYLQNSLVLNMFTGLVFFGLMQAVIPLMWHLGQPTEVVEGAIPYYRYLSWSVLPFMLYACFKQFLEGVGNTKVVMVAVITANAVNILLNYLLIYGKFGFPEMGAAGAGLSTLISRILMPLMVGGYFIYRKKFRRYFSFFSRRNFGWDRIRDLLRVGSPIGAQMFMENSAFVWTSIMMGWFGTAAIAANQIATVLANVAFMIVVGISSATTIRVSHEYGRRNLRVMKKAADASYHLAMFWNVLIATVFIVFRHQIPLIFNTDPEVVSIASLLMIFLAAYQISDGLQVITVGILRGMQDVKSLVWISFLSYIVINIPLGYLCAFVLGWGPAGLWVGFIFGLSTAAVLFMTRFRRRYASMRRGEIARRRAGIA